VPHTTFYNWSMLSVAFVLLLYSDLRPRWLVPALIGVMAVAAAATQAATPWPLPLDRYRPAGTLGIYWIQPAALLSICALALAGRPTECEAAAVSPRPARIVAPRLVARGASAAGTMALAVVSVGVGAIIAAYVSDSGPFRSNGHFGRAQVIGALPADFPLPDDAQLHGAGAGERLPYRIEWRTDAPVSEVAGSMRRRLDDGSWTIVTPSPDGDPASVDLRSSRDGAGEAPLIAEVSVAPASGGSAVRVEFSPVPASSVPGYEEWLESIGLVVHDVAPELIEGSE
jgi:hypothetical protein